MAEKKLKVYAYGNCSTCKKALQFLDKKKVAYENLPIVEQPPKLQELKTMLKHLGGNHRKLFNTSGQLYREMELGKKLDQMTQDEALALLAKHGKLVKRPFVLGEGSGAVGFKKEEWDRFLA